ncbi:MAG: DUF2141 domain-containing protein [Bacteroidales bacterium]|nr:DUF2141 domain-containing protein [Bacteroidales bacterium]
MSKSTFHSIVTIFILYIFSTITAANAQSIESDKSNTLTVEIKGIKKQTGNIIITLFNKSDQFLKRRGALKKASIGVDSTCIIYKFTNLPEGDYAVMTLHDENSDRKMNRNLVGYPTEAYGFSNNFKPSFSAPTFDETKFTLTRNQQITIELIN